MSENCDTNCSSCAAAGSCTSADKKPATENPNPLSSIKKVIAVVSGKGGVGKSLTASLLALESARRGFRTAVLDADITGPSVPRLFGLHGRAEADAAGILPRRTKTGIEVMSINLLLNSETDPVVWRGPIIAGSVKQFWTDVIWHDIDYMFIDMPPGTGDVPLTVFQSIPVDGIVIVTTPQELVSMIVKKAVAMARLMNIKVLGLVENMSWLSCPDCGKKIELFGESRAAGVATEMGIPLLARVPVDPVLASMADSGKIEELGENPLAAAADAIL